MTKTRIALAAFAALAIVPLAHADGRAPTADETTALKSALSSHGFASWGKVEFDDGKWQIDNAVHADGKVYDVDLAQSDMAVIKKKFED